MKETEVIKVPRTFSGPMYIVNETDSFLLGFATEEKRILPEWLSLLLLFLGSFLSIVGSLYFTLKWITS